MLDVCLLNAEVLMKRAKEEEGKFLLHNQLPFRDVDIGALGVNFANRLFRLESLQYLRALRY